MKNNIQKTVLHFSLICILLSGCNAQMGGDKGKESGSDSKGQNVSSSEIVKINIDPDSKSQTTFALNDLVESIEYIPLETKEECVVGTIRSGRDFEISNNYILVKCSSTGRFFLFNRKGGFIAQIGDIGEGPGEYLRTSNSSFIDEENKQIILFALRPDRFLYYDMTGNFIKSVNSENKEIAERIGGWGISFFNESLLIMIPNFGETPFSYTILDNNFNTIAQHVKPLQFTISSGIMVSPGAAFSYYVYENRMHVRNNNLNDTLYFFENSQRIIPKYTINAGIYEITTDLLSDADFFSKSFFNMTTAFETKDHLFIQYLFRGKQNYCYYDKSKQKLFHFSSEKGIPNDYDGGLEFWPQQQHNDVLYSFHDAHLFGGNAEKSDGLQPKGSREAINIMKDFSRKIDPEDNPVLVITKLKK